MPKRQPSSIRLDDATARAVELEARRTRRSKSAVIESLVDEAMRVRRFPGIAFRGDDSARRPWVIGTGLDVWEICALHDENALDDFPVNARQADLARAYREHYPEEIDEALAENHRAPEEWAQLYPFVRRPLPE